MIKESFLQKVCNWLLSGSQIINQDWKREQLSKCMWLEKPSIHILEQKWKTVDRLPWGKDGTSWPCGHMERAKSNWRVYAGPWEHFYREVSHTTFIHPSVQARVYSTLQWLQCGYEWVLTIPLTASIYTTRPSQGTQTKTPDRYKCIYCGLESITDTFWPCDPNLFIFTVITGILQVPRPSLPAPTNTITTTCTYWSLQWAGHCHNPLCGL